MEHKGSNQLIQRGIPQKCKAGIHHGLNLLRLGWGVDHISRVSHIYHAVPIKHPSAVCIFADILDNSFPQGADIVRGDRMLICVVGAVYRVDDHAGILRVRLVKAGTNMCDCGSCTFNGGRRP